MTDNHDLLRSIDRLAGIVADEPVPIPGFNSPDCEAQMRKSLALLIGSAVELAKCIRDCKRSKMSEMKEGAD